MGAEIKKYHSQIFISLVLIKYKTHILLSYSEFYMTFWMCSYCIVTSFGHKMSWKYGGISVLLIIYI